MINVKGYRVLVKPKEIERKSKQGIIISVAGTQEDKLEQAGQQFGVVIGIGDSCWKGDNFDKPWCELGDTILFSKHAGRFVYDYTDDEDLAYMIMNDTDVLAVVE